jgi:CBS domain-containing protein
MIFREPITFTRKVEAVDEKMPLPKIMDIFVKSRFRRLPVVSKNGKLIGIITRRDLMKLFFYQAALT